MVLKSAANVLKTFGKPGMFHYKPKLPLTSQFIGADRA